MKKIKLVTTGSAEIVNLSHDGKGVARIQGKTTFIPGALPGEQVEFQYTRIKKDYDEGRLLSIQEHSPLRTEPRCAHYQLCGGCSLQHVKEQDQIRFKQEHLLDLLQRYGHTKPRNIIPPLSGSHWNYRSKARLSVRYVEKKQRALVGFRERNNPRYISEIDHCPILHARVDTDIVALRQLIESLEDKHSIAQIEVAAGDVEVALIIRHMNPLTANDSQHIREFAQRHHYKIFLQPEGADSVYCFYPPAEQNDDYLSYSLPDHQVDFKFHPTDFTQINSALNRSMVNLALDLMDLKSHDQVLDLFCGLGNFTLPMARLCSRVVGIEGSKTMVDRALMNAACNQLGNVAFYTANLDDAASVKEALAHGGNKVLLDPPRSGALELVRQMHELNPERIVYVSCNPITLARDTDILVNQQGYVLQQAGVMDMFPHTAHVESIALFVKG
jgi:23S rRNA (uracil1939-C5)-methyltransferase